jgi:hypothetical protein
MQSKEQAPRVPVTITQFEPLSIIRVDVKKEWAPVRRALVKHSQSWMKRRRNSPLRPALPPIGYSNKPRQTMDILSRIPLGVASPLFHYHLVLLILTGKANTQILIF